MKRQKQHFSRLVWTYRYRSNCFFVPKAYTFSFGLPVTHAKHWKKKLKKKTIWKIGSGNWNHEEGWKNILFREMVTGGRPKTEENEKTEETEQTIVFREMEEVWHNLCQQKWQERSFSRSSGPKTEKKTEKHKKHIIFTWIVTSPPSIRKLQMFSVISVFGTHP